MLCGSERHGEVGGKSCTRSHWQYLRMRRSRSGGKLYMLPIIATSPFWANCRLCNTVRSPSLVRAFKDHCYVLTVKFTWGRNVCACAQDPFLFFHHRCQYSYILISCVASACHLVFSNNLNFKDCSSQIRSTFWNLTSQWNHKTDLMDDIYLSDSYGSCHMSQRLVRVLYQVWRDLVCLASSHTEPNERKNVSITNMRTRIEPLAAQELLPLRTTMLPTAVLRQQTMCLGMLTNYIKLTNYQVKKMDCLIIIGVNYEQNAQVEIPAGTAPRRAHIH